MENLLFLPQLITLTFVNKSWNNSRYVYGSYTFMMTSTAVVLMVKEEIRRKKSQSAFPFVQFIYENNNKILIEWEITANKKNSKSQE